MHSRWAEPTVEWVGARSVNKDFDAVLLVLLDENFEAFLYCRGCSQALSDAEIDDLFSAKDKAIEFVLKGKNLTPLLLLSSDHLVSDNLDLSCR